MTDARFEDGGERPVNLGAEDADDLKVISALLQDAVLTAADMDYRRRKRQFAMLLNRFRWEDRSAAEREGRRYERVRALLVIGDVLAVRSMGIAPGDKDTVLSLLALDWQPGEDGTGRIVLTFAGDGAIAVDVEALEVTLKDVTRPYAAPSRKAPQHRD
ncbi:DUF2948 family protein [Aliigemmobacter aestuarii]|uniref:DUF2948 family protein n=1 Tax=Aliigemmobacter aestuarii TaxID=1445661 RepID=A0A4S3MQV1_9RHOB|nr:DUF2948 family protein [Gemmobacter aestuarii]THD84797.1 DUF2948 family protein [Gemmobacter aestuarii]